MLNYGKPENSYEIINSEQWKKIESETSTMKIDIEDNQFLGPITDFQIFGLNLYVINANGFLSIMDLVKAEDMFKLNYREKILSLKPLQASNPTSIAVTENYVCVLAASSIPFGVSNTEQ